MPRRGSSRAHGVLCKPTLAACFGGPHQPASAPARLRACPGFFPVSLGRGVLTNPWFPPFAVLPGPRNSWTDRISKVVEHTHRRSPLASCPSYRLLRRHANPTSEAQAPSPEESRKELAGKFSANAAGRRVASPQPGADRQGPALGQVAGPPLLVFCCVVLCCVLFCLSLAQTGRVKGTGVGYFTSLGLVIKSQ